MNELVFTIENKKSMIFIFFVFFMLKKVQNCMKRHFHSFKAKVEN